jgi:tripartite-type tricarboxylate transporter receptor subunit TctC
LLPDAPTFSEAGLPGFEVSLWMAIVVPAATPPAIVKRLNEEINVVLKSAEGKAAMSKQGVDAEPSTPDQLAARIRDDTAKWRDVIAKAHIKPE